MGTAFIFLRRHLRSSHMVLQRLLAQTDIGNTINLTFTPNISHDIHRDLAAYKPNQFTFLRDIIVRGKTAL
jgi:hypothetical protein